MEFLLMILLVGLFWSAIFSMVGKAINAYREVHGDNKKNHKRDS